MRVLNTGTGFFIVWFIYRNDPAHVLMSPTPILLSANLSESSHCPVGFDSRCQSGNGCHNEIAAWTLRGASVNLDLWSRKWYRIKLIGDA
jgi:hypothetical protein